MTILKSPTRLHLAGRGEVTVQPSDYLATGGEGSVYRINDTIIKLYTDTSKFVKDGMRDKIQALSTIKHPQIIAPIGSVSHSGRDLGYYMPYVDGEPLSRMFTNDFLTRYNIGTKGIVSVVKSMREIVSAAHKAGAILVDANELNWLVALRKGTHPIPYVIDVDSWAIGKWKATVIMPSIQDVHSQSFNEKSDWFSFAVVSFQLFTGIHPYKGVLAGYDRGDLKKRMKDNASVFHKDVRLSRAVRDFSLIPKGLLEWYKAVFSDGERSAPPIDFEQTKGYVFPSVIVTKKVQKSSSKLLYTKLLESPGKKIINVFPSGVVLHSDGSLKVLHQKQSLGSTTYHDVEVVEIDNGYVVVGKTASGNGCTFIDKKSLVQEEVAFPFEVEKFIRFENRLFGVTAQGLAEFSFHKFARVVASVKTMWNALPQVTTWLSGFGLQNTLGTTYVIFPQGESACSYVHVKELDGFTVLSGVRGSRNFSVTGLTRSGQSKRYDFYFDATYQNYSVVISDVDTFDLVEVSLPKGLCLSIVDDGKLNVASLSNGSVLVIDDNDIRTDAKLYHKGDTVLYVRKESLWSISMK